ncbi:MAG: hypothetical protein M3R24_05390 [Chloroflexota bacterium]|nr:hypothetical protein [Chloroflexota bacterium]
MVQYVQAAMRKARVDELSTGGWFGALPQFHAVMAWGATEEACIQALQADLESAIEEAVRHQRRLPQLDGVETPTREHLVQS